MSGTKLAGGSTQDEIMAVSLSKLGLRSTDTVLEIGSGTGKVSIAIAQQVKNILSLDKRPEAIRTAQEAAQNSGIHNIEFFCTDATDFLTTDRVFDCAFVGGTQQISRILPILAKKVKRTIVVNAVLLSTLSEAVATMKDLGIFHEVVQVQVSRSYDIAGSIMFKPIDPVYIIVGKADLC
jgi:cobalt-precorrin-6B (C15)-methyltransferase